MKAQAQKYILQACKIEKPKRCCHLVAPPGLSLQRRGGATCHETSLKKKKNTYYIQEWQKHVFCLRELEGRYLFSESELPVFAIIPMTIN